MFYFILKRKLNNFRLNGIFLKKKVYYVDCTIHSVGKDIKWNGNGNFIIMDIQVYACSRVLGIIKGLTLMKYLYEAWRVYRIHE